jgi:hypothetical protein
MHELIRAFVAIIFFVFIFLKITDSLFKCAKVELD